MTDDDRELFAAAMFTLADVFNEALTETKLETYFEALQPHDIDRVLAACKAATKTCEFFPRPAHLLRLLDGDRQADADLAWGAVLREVRRVGYIGTPDLEPAILRAVCELWGSWERLCQTLPAEGPELVGWIKQFKSVYESGVRREQRALTMGDLHPTVRAFIDFERRRFPREDH